MGFIRPVLAAGASLPAGVHASPCGDRGEGSQSTAEWVVTALLDDGKKRQGGTILLFAEDGYWKACLTDRQEGLVAWASSETLEGILDAVEVGLGEGGLEWRKKKIWKPNGR